MPIPASHLVRFGVFELDRQTGELRRHGLKIRLPDQSFQILQLLLSRPGQVVTREELRNVLWTSQTFVDFEVGLNRAVRKLREALDDSADNPRFVETLPRRGYRFVAPVSLAAGESEPPAAPVTIASVPEGTALPAPIPTVPATLSLASIPAPAAARPTGLIRARAVLGALLLAILMFAAYRQWGPVGVRATPVPIRTIVVLPFENLTGDAAQDPFADTVTDAVTIHLGQVSGLDVISRTSARQYKDTGKPLKSIAQDLTVDGVVSGTVVKSAPGVGITVHLIRAATERDVWAQTYQGDLSHIMELQQRIASDIAVAAGRPAPPRPGLATTQVIDPVAYSAYVKGLTAQGQQRFEGFKRAAAYFEEAVGIQPDFAEAHAALAHVQLQFLFGGPLSPHEAIPKAEAAARRALQLDDSLSRAHKTLGQILILYHWRQDEGDKALARCRAARRCGGRCQRSDQRLAGATRTIRRSDRNG